jgi:hypothetical protein
MKLTLHVGLPKTATTTIQHSLSDAKKELAALGVAFPGISTLHHEVVRTVELVEAGRHRFERHADAILSGFAEEVRALAPQQMLMSSEAMITMSGGAILRLKDMLLRHFPQISGFSVLCYVREPIAFATSIGQQNLKAGVQRLEELYQNPWSIRLEDCLGQYISAYGRENVHVRYFHPDHLVGGEPVIDFLHALGIGQLILPKGAAVLNPSLSNEGALVADALAEVRPRRLRSRYKRRAYKRLVESIAGSRFCLPVEVQERVVEQSRQDMAALKAMFGVSITPKRVEVPGAYALPPETAMAVARLIERIVEGDISDGT